MPNEVSLPEFFNSTPSDKTSLDSVRFNGREFKLNFIDPKPDCPCQLNSSLLHEGDIVAISCTTRPSFDNFIGLFVRLGHIWSAPIIGDCWKFTRDRPPHCLVHRLFFFRPDRSPKFHIINDLDYGRALCGKWSHIGPVDDLDAVTLKNIEDGSNKDTDCTPCWRKLDKVQVRLWVTA